VQEERALVTRLPRGALWSGQRQIGSAAATDARGLARSVEAAGLPMLWISESTAREVMSFAAILLAATDRLILGTGVANMWARDPMAMANGARTLAEAFPGRFVLGIGVSHQPLVSARGQDYARPVAAVRAYLEAMAKAPWTGPTAGADPGGRLPVLVGALGPRMIAAAGELADGVHPYLVTPERIAGIRAQLGTGPVIVAEQAVVLDADRDRAYEVARQHLAVYLALDNYRRSFLRQGFSPEDLEKGGSDRLVDRLVAWGDGDTLRSRVRGHLDAGADQVAVQLLGGSPTRADLSGVAELLP
jgi:probable F420-dependent oxidoreductase